MADLALAVIGGTGVYKLADLQDVETRELETRFGAPSGPVRIGTLDGRRVAFLARHGEGPDRPGSKARPAPPAVTPSGSRRPPPSPPR